MFLQTLKKTHSLFKTRISCFHSFPRANFSPRTSPLFLLPKFPFSSQSVKIPFMGDSITEGRVLEIPVKTGDSVSMDQVIAVIETDKTSLEIRAPTSGKVTKIHSSVDSTVQVDTLLMEIDSSSTTKDTPDKNKSELNLTSEKEKTEIKQENVKMPSKIKPPPKSESENLVKNLNGALKNDNINTNNDANSNSGDRLVPMSRMRIKIAQRLKESQNTAASLTAYNQIDCSALIDMRSKYKDTFEKKNGVKLGFMSAFVKAATQSLLQFPEVNAYMNIASKTIEYHDYVDISVAVASPAGLVVPVLRNTERMSFAHIEKQIKSFAVQAKEGKLKLSDMEGGTFTISNSGVFKALIGTPIINPPQSAVLGIYAINDTPVVIDGQIKVRPIMKVALTYDHRIIDGRESALFLRSIKEYIEDPMNMLLQ